MSGAQVGHTISLNLKTAIAGIVNAWRAEGLVVYRPSPKGWVSIKGAIEG